MTISFKRSLYSAWLVLIGGFALLHALNLRADFPNHSPWFFDGAMYTDEGWWASAAIHAHLTGNWYPQFDYNPAPAVPVWPFLEWVVFCFTGVTIEVARGLAVALFLVNLVLSYLLLRGRGPRWMPLLALNMLVTSPFLYSFSRMALLEPLVTTLMLAALNLAVRLRRFRRPVWSSIVIGLLFALMVLTKTSAIFLLPALGWAMLLPLWKDRKLARQCTLTAACSSAVILNLWMALVVHSRLLSDFRNFFLINRSPWPNHLYWPPHFLHDIPHTGRKVDPILVPLSILVALGVTLARRSSLGSKVWLDPVFGASVWAIIGYLLFMIYHDYSPPRYFGVVIVFCFLIVAQGVGALLGESALAQESNGEQSTNQLAALVLARLSIVRLLGYAVIIPVALAVGINGARTVEYASHPEFTFVNAARQLTQYIDNHPNGKRLLVSGSGDQITLVTNLLTLCTPEASGPCSLVPNPASKLALYQPGWFAEWYSIDPRTLELLHTHFSLEQVASFHVFDDPDPNSLVLFKLHPLPAGEVRDPAKENLQVPLPDDKIDIPVHP